MDSICDCIYNICAEIFCCTEMDETLLYEKTSLIPALETPSPPPNTPSWDDEDEEVIEYETEYEVV